ncbi:MAG TPA: alkaline phosphatase family protein [Gemmatimonadaceae bacterium]|nr:alkaline phosphatase family protein [Gemmatimonadaceae bacterium]
MPKPSASRHCARLLLLAAVALPSAALASDTTRVDSTRARSAATAKTGFMSSHVIVISVDGLRPDAIAKYNATTMQRLMRGGSFTLDAHTILPSKTLPSHTSMLTGVDVDQHGVTWNSDETASHGHVDVPTIFGLARTAGFQTAAFFSKPKFHHLEAKNTLDYVRSPKGGILDTKWSAERTVAEVKKYLGSTSAAPNLMFVHIGEPDYAGHVFGWMGFVYGQAVRQADAAVANVLAAADARFGAGNYSVILTADHGGHGRNHGSEDARDTTIPWIVWGKGVTRGATLGDIRTMDTAATALWLLGVEMPDTFEGRAVAGAFTLAATASR